MFPSGNIEPGLDLHLIQSSIFSFSHGEASDANIGFMANFIWFKKKLVAVCSGCLNFHHYRNENFGGLLSSSNFIMTI